jgi:hypothetical protein
MYYTIGFRETYFAMETYFCIESKSFPFVLPRQATSVTIQKKKEQSPFSLTGAHQRS